jgi:hypothetical protein
MIQTDAALDPAIPAVLWFLRQVMPPSAAS